MGNISFNIPDSIDKTLEKELLKSYFSGGPDTMPFFSIVSRNKNILSLKKDEPDSCFLNIPWNIGNQGFFISPTSTLPLSDSPYSLITELARGKVNQFRNFNADWEFSGLKINQELRDQLSKSTLEFGKSFSSSVLSQQEKHLQTAIEYAYQGSDLLIREYIRQIFDIRHQGNQPFETGLSAKISKPFPASLSSKMEQSFNYMQVGFNWKKIESSQGIFSWDEVDQTVESCLATGMEVIGGPVIQITKESLPEWLASSTSTASQYATAMARFLDTVIRRYEGKIHRWIICSGLNVATEPAFGDETYFRIACKLAEIAKQIHSSLEIIIGVTQPWGEYTATKKRAFSPFIFTDNLCRAGLNLAAIDIEIVMGSSPNGSFCRDMLETSRLLDLYAVLGMPLTITLGYPSIKNQDELGDYEFGNWKGSKTPATQADWAESFTSLALSKRYIQSIHWAEIADDPSSDFPNCGLFDKDWVQKPAFAHMEKIRKTHLR
ncbi:MAG: hypothetical protein EBT92_01540 [Planctomycetes bacterium]|nr:hypothetical protein [Planctomycetota bacterium]NBY02825.1 hypothetical protein [Planctomycetota bacterium]